jgi:hypothetical protein
MKNKFKFGMHVVIIKGFYQDQTGILVYQKKNQYQIRLDNGHYITDFIDAKFIKLVL